MQYIVVDLEWNQPMSFQSQIYRKVGNKLIFEIIQIGAVKLDSDFNICDSISIPIKPQYYVKIHPRIKKMTGLGNEELEDAPYFQEAMDQFTEWCGNDYTLLTWGCDDVSVLQQNLDFFECHPELPALCDIQRMFSDIQKCKDRKGLKIAMDMLGIEPDENLAFHNALHDAYYTALVFAKLPDPASVLNYPQQPKQLIHQKRFENSNIKGEIFDNIAAALSSANAVEPHCPVCGKKSELEDTYVMQTADKYIGLANCKAHGTMLIKVRFQATDEGKCIFALNITKASPSNKAYVHTKKLQVEQRNAEWLKTHDSLPDPDAELQAADRSSMPFED